MNDPLETRANALVNDTAKSVAHQEELAHRVADARTAMKMSCDLFRPEFLTYAEELSVALESLRAMRMAMNMEVTQITKSLEQFKDVRKFFLSDEHTQEVERLKEFVELCERLKSLKESGFLDQVADTILKLEKI